MAARLSIPNYSPENVVETSYLTADAAAGQNVIVIANASDHEDDDYVRIGTDEHAEILQIQSITNNQITFTTNLVNAHSENEGTQKLMGNQIRIYRVADSAIAGSIPTAAELELGGVFATVDIEADQGDTYYDDSTGGSDYWYIFTYFHETSEAESSTDDALPTRGGGYLNYVGISVIRRAAGFQGNDNITDDQIADARDEAENEVKSALVTGGYTLPMSEPIPGAIKNIVKRLACAYLLQDEYGTDSEGTGKDGFKREDQVRKILDKVTLGKLNLINPADDSTIENTEGTGVAITGYPDNTTDGAALSDGGDDGFMFPVGKRW